MISKNHLIEHGIIGKCYFYFIIFHLLSRGTRGLVPEAIHIDSLSPFKSYSDVAIFHYTVPKEVPRATWQFAAFMDGKNCISRKVHIYMQSGNYPVIDANNATFPSRMVPERGDTIRLFTMTTYDAQTTGAVVPVNSPEPGDWFVGAYMSHWDEKVQQKGLGDKCRYGIVSVTTWLQINGIQTIPVGHEEIMTTTELSTYYKIYIPSETWHFRVTISDCKPAINDTSELCIRGLSLRARVLPIVDHTHDASMGNLAKLGTYNFTEFSPNEDGYYYLLVVSDTPISFRVKVTTYECPVKITENTFLRSWLIDNSSLHGNTLHYNEGNEIISGDPCVRRLKLARSHHAQTFSSTYFVQGKHGLTHRIILTDSSIVIAQFDVLPLVDIGGTLDITIRLETDKLSTKQLVVIEVCIRRGRTPDRNNGDLLCSDETMQLNVSSHDKGGSSLLIPYPKPDTWYIAMQAKCFTDGNPVGCEAPELPVSLDVQTRQCVFSGPHSCGRHGLCQEIQKGPLYYATCNCFPGYSGWGCTDSTSVNSRVSSRFSSFVLTFSNAFFLPAIFTAVKRGLYTEGLVYLATMLLSSLYHACDQQFMNYCIAKYEVLQYSDFFSGILSFWVTLVAMAQLPIRLVPIFHMFGVLIIAFGVESDRTGLPTILVPLAIGVTIPILAVSIRCCKSRKFIRPKNLWKLLTGLGLAGLGLVIYVSAETESNYNYVHSVWHILMALSILFLLPPMQTRSSEDSLSITSTSELIEDPVLFQAANSVCTIGLNEEYPIGGKIR